MCSLHFDDHTKNKFNNKQQHQQLQGLALFKRVRQRGGSRGAGARARAPYLLARRQLTTATDVVVITGEKKKKMQTHMVSHEKEQERREGSEE